MDRQSLLEQKRARLQQLKQRRLTLESSLLVSLILERHLATEKKAISVATQTDTIVDDSVSISQAAAVVDEAPELTKFDKSIQTSWELAAAAITDVPTPVAEAPPTPKTITVYVPEPAPPSQFSTFLALRPKLKLAEQSTTNPISHHWQDVGMKNRQCVAVDYSPHFAELAVVAFSAKSLTKPGDSPGVAIVYNMDERTPQFLLQCMLALTTIKFDVVDTKKIFGGCIDGLVVVWNLDELPQLEVAIFPQLATPMALVTHDGDYRPHTMAIIGLHQYTRSGDNLIVLVLADGVVNSWSPNLLAKPKHPLVGLLDLLYFEVLVLIPPSGHDTISLQKQYFNLLITAGADGRIYAGVDDVKRNYIGAVLDPLAPIADVKVLLDKYLVSAHIDLSLRIWRVTPGQVELVHSIHTEMMVSKLVAKLATEFITIGTTRTGEPLVDYWDVGVKGTGPLVPIDVDGNVSLVGVSKENLLVGLQDGQVLVYNIGEIAFPKGKDAVLLI